MGKRLWGKSLIKMAKVMILSLIILIPKISSFGDELLIKSLFGDFKPYFLCDFIFLGFLR